MSESKDRHGSQLLAGLAGTLIEAAARDAEQAAFLVHAFHSGRFDVHRVAANDAGWARFLRALPGGDGLDPRYRLLHGPLQLPGGEGIPSMPLYLGIAATTIDEPSTATPRKVPSSPS